MKRKLKGLTQFNNIPLLSDWHSWYMLSKFRRKFTRFTTLSQISTNNSFIDPGALEGHFHLTNSSNTHASWTT
jgi:hypothetical protein